MNENRFPPYKPGPLPPLEGLFLGLAGSARSGARKAAALGSLEIGGYRPPPETILKVLEDERE